MKPVSRFLVLGISAILIVSLLIVTYFLIPLYNEEVVYAEVLVLVSESEEKVTPIEKEMISGQWIDPDGCAHWILDDGVEGWMSPALDRYGAPICIAPKSIETEAKFLRQDFRGRSVRELLDQQILETLCENNNCGNLSESQASRLLDV